MGIHVIIVVYNEPIGTTNDVAQVIIRPVCLCRLTPFIITFGVDADVIDI